MSGEKRGEVKWGRGVRKEGKWGANGCIKIYSGEDGWGLDGRRVYE